MRNNSQRMQVPMPSASSALGLTLHTNGLSNVGQSAPAGSRQASHTCMGTAQFQGGVSQGPGGAGASASALLHHRVQMLACNASSAGVLMLQTLVQLLQQPCLPHLRKQDGAAEAAAREAGTNPQQKDAAAGAPSGHWAQAFAIHTTSEVAGLWCTACAVLGRPCGTAKTNAILDTCLVLTQRIKLVAPGQGRCACISLAPAMHW